MSDDAADHETMTVYADYVCPFCYLGKQSLEAYRADRDADLAIDWHPFDLRSDRRGPDGEIESLDVDLDSDYFERVQRNVDKLREQYGADEMLALDAVPDVDSLDTQVASTYVDREHPEAWPAFDEALYEALWTDGRDIGDRDVIADVAESVGLDGEAVRSALDDEALRADVFEAFETASQEDGVTGVPTFVYDGTAAQGAVPPAQLRRLVEGA